MRLMHFVKAGIFFALGFTAQLVFVLTGLVVCLLPKNASGDATVFTQNIGMWRLVGMPKIAWLWDNDADGAMGDKRGWYWCEYGVVSGWSDYWKYYFWLAIRNPANNFKRKGLGFDIRTKSIETIYGNDYVRDDFSSTGFQLVRAGWRYHLYWVRRWSDTSSRAIVIELGNKFQVKHNGAQYESEHKYVKGFTFEINPYKDIS